MERTEIAEKYKWKTTDVFESDEAWEKALAKLEKKIDFAHFRGTLSSAENILAYFKAEEAFTKQAMLVYLYAYLKHDEDMRVSKYNSDVSRVIALLTRAAAETAFVTPELTALNGDVLDTLIADKRLKNYDYLLARVKASKAHTLSEREEVILAQVSDPLGAAGDAFEILVNAELSLPEIEYEGKKQPLTHGLYTVIMNGRDRKLRAKAYKLYYSAYRKILNTLATTYFGNVKKDIFYKTVRGYKSSLDMALFEEDVDASVYERLITSVDKATPLLHRYMALRKRVFGYKELHFYDIQPSMVESDTLRLDYEEAFELVIKGLSPLGEEYVALLKKARDEGWIDVMESEGKRIGAYAIGVYGMHPFVLLNYQKTTQDIFTIAHELGHAMHSHFSAQKQPFAKSEYKIFVAEVASTVNETLLLKYLLQNTTDKNLRKYLLNYFMDTVRTTIFRQAQFAEFEAAAHELAEGGEPLNKDNLSDLYASLNKKYYGPALTYDEDIAIEWARVPHFYRSFYVYKYATGLTAAITIANRILTEGEPAVKDYMKFLSGGGSTDPVSLLKLAGVDLTKEETFAVAMKEFETALNEFEKLA